MVKVMIFFQEIGEYRMLSKVERENSKTQK